MKTLLIQYPDGYYELLSDTKGDNKVVVVPVAGTHFLETEIVRRSLSGKQQDIWDYGHLVDYGYFSFSTAAQAEIEKERRWNRHVIEALDRHLFRLRNPGPQPLGRKKMRRDAH